MKEKGDLSKFVLLGDKKIKTVCKICRIEGCKEEGWPNGSVGKGLLSSWQPEFYSGAPHGRREWIFLSCPMISLCAPWQTHTQIKTNKWNFNFKMLKKQRHENKGQNTGRPTSFFIWRAMIRSSVETSAQHLWGSGFNSWHSKQITEGIFYTKISKHVN